MCMHTYSEKNGRGTHKCLSVNFAGVWPSYSDHEGRNYSRVWGCPVSIRAMEWKWKTQTEAKAKGHLFASKILKFTWLSIPTPSLKWNHWYPPISKSTSFKKYLAAWYGLDLTGFCIPLRKSKAQVVRTLESPLTTCYRGVVMGYFCCKKEM